MFEKMPSKDSKLFLDKIIYFIELSGCIYYIVDIFKGIDHPKMKILSLITHPHVIPNP